MHDTKARLIAKNGTICMLCGREVGRHIEWHHIVPKCYYRNNNLPINNEYSNGILLCHECHRNIHSYKYYSVEYKCAMEEATKNRKD